MSGRGGDEERFIEIGRHAHAVRVLFPLPADVGGDEDDAEAVEHHAGPPQRP